MKNEENKDKCPSYLHPRKDPCTLMVVKYKEAEWFVCPVYKTHSPIHTNVQKTYFLVFN